MDKILLNGRVKLRHIQCFLAVAQLRTIQKAAQRLSITQPAVSKTLAELEEAVGMRLFERSRRGAELTEEGRIFAPYADACLGNLRSGLDKLVHAHDGPATVVHFGVLPTVARVLIPEAIRVFRVKWPIATIQITTCPNAELLERLAAAEISFAVGRLGEPSAMAGMSFEHLYREPLTVVVHAQHPLLKHNAPGNMPLGDYPLVVAPQGTLIRQSTDSILAALNTPTHHSMIESLSVSLNLELTLQNDALWFVPASLVEQQVSSGLLVPLNMPFGGTDEPIGLLRRTDTVLTPAALGLFEALREAGLSRERKRVAKSGRASGGLAP